MKSIDNNNRKYLQIGLVLVAIVIANWSIYALKPGVDSVRQKQAEYAPKYIEYIISENKRVLTQMSASLANDASWSKIEIKKLYDSMKSKEHMLDKFPELRNQDRALRDAEIYIWITDSTNRYVTGSPPATFVYLNEIYNNHLTKLKSDKFFDDRDAFFTTFCNVSEQFDFSSTMNSEGKPSDWRFYESEEVLLGNKQAGVFTYSNNIIGINGEFLGQISAKIDDSQNYYLIYTDLGEERQKNHYRYYFLINFICLLALWYLLPAWIYTDAVSRGVKRPFVWAMLGVFSNVVALFIYLINRPHLMLKIACPQCQKNLPAKAEFCPHCSFQLAALSCPSCKKQVESDWTFCSSCGFNLDQKPADIPGQPLD